MAANNFAPKADSFNTAGPERPCLVINIGPRCVNDSCKSDGDEEEAKSRSLYSLATVSLTLPQSTLIPVNDVRSSS